MTNPSVFVLTNTQRVQIGVAAADAIANECETLGASRVFLLVSRTLRQETDEIKKIETALGSKIAGIHDGIPAHAPRSAVLEAANHAREVKADLIVTIGGGSVVDAGKIIPLLLKHNLRQHDDMNGFFVYVNDDGETIKPEFDGTEIPVICCPTTLSGGEFNPLAGATDEKLGHKQGFEHPSMVPVCIVLDPRLTLHTPEWLWTSTGVRSVDHGIETLGSLQSDYFSDGIAESALRLLSRALPEVKANPSNLEARLQCQVGAWQSMIPIIGGVPMGASHAIGHILGGTADVPHGYCSCVMAPAVLKYNESVNRERQAVISACFGRPNDTASVVVDEFISGLDMPRNLPAVGVTEDQLDHIAEYTMMDFWTRTNPRPISSATEVRTILDLAMS